MPTGARLERTLSFSHQPLSAGNFAAPLPSNHGMTSTRNRSFLAFLLVAAAVASPCFAVMDIEEVTPARARELALDLRAKPAGPDAVSVSLEFDTTGELKSFGRVDLEMREGAKLLLSSTLKEDHPGPGRVAVSFAADRAHLDHITLRVVTGVPMNMNMVGHDLRLKDFVDPKKLAPAATTPEEESRFLAAVRKAFEARDASGLDALTCWDRVPAEMKKRLQATYASLVAEKGAVFDFKLADPNLTFVDRERTEDGVTYSMNLPLTRQLEMKGMRPTDKQTLFVLTFGVGEKDGKLLLTGSAPVK